MYCNLASSLLINLLRMFYYCSSVLLQTRLQLPMVMEGKIIVSRGMCVVVVHIKGMYYKSTSYFIQLCTVFHKNKQAFLLVLNSPSLTSYLKSLTVELLCVGKRWRRQVCQ